MKTTYQKHPSALAAKIAAVNAANEAANELRPVLLAAFAPFFGEKILKTDGTLLEKVRKIVPELPSTTALSVYRHSASYSLVYYVKTCQGYGAHSCVYHETPVYIGELDGATLKPLAGNPQTDGRTDHSEGEILALREVNAAAKRAASAAASALYPFGEYDR